MMNQSKPLYQQVYSLLKQNIQNGRFDPNQPLPNQIELAKQFEVSEITARRALAELVNEGLIFRIRGKGTFVKEDYRELKAPAQVPIKQIYFAVPQMDLQVLNQRFFRDLISGIDEFCQTHGIQFRLWDIKRREGLPLESEVGIVLLPDYSLMPMQALEKLNEENHRIVMVHMYSPHLQIPYVIIDNLTGGYTATQHLLSLGHRRIGMVITGNSFQDLNQEFSLRLQGYKLALDQNRIAFDESLICIVPGNQELEKMGYDGMKHLLAHPEPPTAVFATSDYKAIGCIRAIEEHGLSVPDDFSVIGYDDIPTGKYLIPSLTTIDQNAQLMGWRAAEILTFGDEGTSKSQFKDEISPKLIVRESTAPLN